MFDVKFPADSKWDELWENLAACIWPSNVTNEELQESIDWLHKHSEKFKSVSGLLSWQSGQMLLKILGHCPQHSSSTYTTFG